MLISWTELVKLNILENLSAFTEKFELQKKKIRDYLAAFLQYLIELYDFLHSLIVFSVLQEKPRRDFYIVTFSKTNHRILKYQHQLAPPFHIC